MNVLCGVGVLSTPYAVKEGGWLGLSILLIFAVLSYYTGILLRSCLDSQPGIETYPDIGQAAFGRVGRIVISVSLITSSIFCLHLELKFQNIMIDVFTYQIKRKSMSINYLLMFLLYCMLFMQIILYVELYVSILLNS